MFILPERRRVLETVKKITAGNTEAVRITSAAQQAKNDKRALARLELLLAENYTGRNLFFTLTYRDAALPSRREGAAALVSRFLLELRKHHTARGLALKYVCTTEGQPGAARLHHHLVINTAGQDIETIRGMWPFGDVLDAEQVNETDYAALAVHITRENTEGRPIGARMWSGSRNLKQPAGRSRKAISGA